LGVFLPLPGAGLGQTLRRPYASHVTLCPNCGHENESEARFCSRCGTALAEAVAPARTERKVVTVLFADLVGFTARAERLDPEDVQAVLAPYHARLRSELERYGGTVEKFIGDAVMALFGAPVAHEDDPERAVRAALAIRDWIAEEGQLQVRIAVNTGEALVNLAARPEVGEGMAAGDVVNTAARLQSVAPANGILAGETTYRSTAQSIEYREPTTVEAKGKGEPITVWEVVQARSRFGVDLAPRPAAPLVGREREVELLTGALTRARQQRSPELVTLVGVPGIGKSRLVAELFASIESGKHGLVYWRQGRSLPYGEGVSYWALAEMVKAQAGILETDSAEDAKAKLTRALAGLIEEDTGWVRSHLLTLVGQGTELAVGSRDEAFAAWRRFFEALAEQRPLVLIFEDVQWADDGLLDFIEHLVDWVSGVPMLVLCTARLELLERRPAWGGGKVNAATVAVAPLSNDETAVLISSLSERPLLPAETQSALLERAGGNPLYAEQYVRMLAERATAEDLPLPESVQGIIAARLDALAPAEKALLQDAAVIGKVFWLGALSATEQQLHALQQKEFVQRARRSSVEGETEFAFKHLLVRDVAYGQIPRAERAEKHQRAAEWIESLGRPEDHAEMVAHHYLSALELARAAGHDVAPIAARARTSLREAGDRAASLNALSQADRYYGQALDLIPHDDPERPELLFRQGRVQYLRAQEGAEQLATAMEGLVAAGDRETAAEAALMLANISWHEGRRDKMLAQLDEARALVAGTPASRAHTSVLSELSRYEMLAGRPDSAIGLGREAIDLASKLDLDDLRLSALNNVGSARGLLGDRGGIADVEESIRLASELNSASEIVRGHNNLAVMHLVHGEVVQAQASWQEARRLAEQFGHHGFMRFLDAGAAMVNRYLLGEWDDALARAEAFLVKIERGSADYHAAISHVIRGLIRLARADGGAEADAERAVEYARPVRDAQIVQPAFARAALVFFSAGNERRAGETLDEALAHLRELPRLGFSAIDLHRFAWVARGLGRETDVLTVIDGEAFQSPWLVAARAVASGDFRQAADVLGGIGVVTEEAFYRLRAADQLVADGRQAEADQQLRPALAFYRSVGATRYVREGEALLAASA
jgi:class 3 adenylate cyclase/tetratricopeptide (TPR) repeat protein